MTGAPTDVGTAAMFLDIAFGIAPVGLGMVADAGGYGSAFLVSAVLAAIGSGLLLARRAALAPAVPAPTG